MQSPVPVHGPNMINNHQLTQQVYLKCDRVSYNLTVLSSDISNQEGNAINYPASYNYHNVIRNYCHNIKCTGITTYLPTYLYVLGLPKN